jgi:DNA polymerase/3'-5' exonuclease PolX
VELAVEGDTTEKWKDRGKFGRKNLGYVGKAFLDSIHVLVESRVWSQVKATAEDYG